MNEARWDLRGVQVRTNPFVAVRGNKTAMRPFVKIPLPLVIISIIIRPHGSDR